MKQFLSLCATVFLMACGMESAPSDSSLETRSDTLEDPLTYACENYHGNIDCPSGYTRSEYLCKADCPYNIQCTNRWNAAVCSPTDVAHVKCGRWCGQGFYAEWLDYSHSCIQTRSDTLPAHGDSNRTSCVPNPAPNQVSSYTKCGVGGCATGYYRHSDIYLPACRALLSQDTTTPNATICNDIP